MDGVGKTGFMWPAVLVLVVVGFAVPAQALTLGSNANVTAGTLAGGAETIIARTGTDGSRSTPYVFDWSDMNGDGVAGPAASADLVLGGYKVYTTDPSASTKSFTLSLNGGSVTGSTAAGVVAFDSSTTQFGFSAGHIAIQNVNNVVMGKVLATKASSDVNGGNFSVGTAVARAGFIRIGAIDVRGGNDTKSSGNVTLYGGSDIEVRDDSATNSILTATLVPVQPAGTGKITLSHQGNLKAGELDSGSLYGNNGSADIVLDGAAVNGVPSGAAILRNIYAGRYPSMPASNHKGSAVTVRGYTGIVISGDIITRQWDSSGYPHGVTITNIGSGGVAIRDVDAREAANGTAAGTGGNLQIVSAGPVTIRNVVLSCNSWQAGYYSGNMTVVADGRISVSGSVDLSAVAGSSYCGTMILSNSSAYGSVRVGSLDLTKVVSAKLYSGDRHSAFTNALTGFPVTNPASGKLDAVTGQKIHYDSTLSANAYLTNGYSGIFTLASGGVLTPSPLPGKGTSITIR